MPDSKIEANQGRIAWNFAGLVLNRAAAALNSFGKSIKSATSDKKALIQFERRSTTIALVLGSVCLLLSVAVCVRAARDTLLWTTPVPYFDQVTSIWLTNQWLTHTLPFRSIWRWHNEHLILFPQIVYLIDIILFRNRAGFLVACSWTLFVAQAAAFLYFIWTELRLQYALLASAVVLTFLFSPSQMENLVWGFQVQYAMATVFATFAIVFLVRVLRSRSPWRDAGFSIGSAVISSFSFSTGLLIWPCLILAAFKLRLHNPKRIAFVVSGAATITVIFWARAIQAPSSLAVRPTPIQYWHFLCAMVGLTWSFHLSTLSVVVTATSILMMLALLVRFLRARTPGALATVVIGIALFSFAWLLLVAFGRAAEGLALASSQRYQTTVLCYFACLIVGCLEWAHASKWPIVQVASVAFLAAIYGAIPMIHAIETSARNGAQFFQLADAALKVGVYDPNVLGGALLLGTDTIPQFELSRQHDFSVFADREHRLLGVPISRRFHLSAACPGKILGERNIQSKYPGIYLDGFKQEPGRLILVTSQGTIVGLGSAKVQVPDLWLAYVRPVKGPLDVYSVASHGSACLIATYKQ